MHMKNIIKEKIRKKFEINVVILDRGWKRALPNIVFFAKKVAEQTLKQVQMSLPRSSLSIVLANNDFVRELNKSYRSKNEYTNVLSFPADECIKMKKVNKEIILGDVILALKKIREESKEQNKIFQNHFAHLIVHGILHLLGYIHLHRKEAEEMEELERIILKNMGIGNPYILDMPR